MKILFKQPTSHQVKPTEAVAHSFKEAGHDIYYTTSYNKNEVYDIACFWAHRQRQLMLMQAKHDKDYLVMERGYVDDRFTWYSLGFNGLNGRADFVNGDITDSHRWDSNFSHCLKPWKTDIKDKPILVIGQVPNDAAVKHVNIKTWYKKTIEHYLGMNKKVIFRKHPLDKTPYEKLGPGITIDRNPELETTLQTVSNCVTFSSNSGVVSVLHGVPTIAVDEGSMVGKYVPSNLSNLDQTFNRQDWCNKIAYCQWTLDEIRHGLAWEHLKQKYA